MGCGCWTWPRREMVGRPSGCVEEGAQGWYAGGVMEEICQGMRGTCGKEEMGVVAHGWCG